MPAKNAPIVLLFVNDLSLQRRLLPKLEQLGYDAHKAGSTSETIKKIASGVYELLVVDLPNWREILALLKKLRSFSTVPIIVISDRSDVAGRIDILDKGADDFIVKPIDVRELLARAKAILRRVGRTKVESGPLLFDGLIIDFATRQVKRGELCFKLTAKEGRLLKILAAQAGQVVSQQVLLAHVWGERHLDDRDYLRVLVWKVRKKIELDPENPRILLSARGVGYMIAATISPTKGWAPPKRARTSFPLCL